MLLACLACGMVVGVGSRGCPMVSSLPGYQHLLAAREVQGEGEVLGEGEDEVLCQLPESQWV